MKKKIEKFKKKKDIQNILIANIFNLPQLQDHIISTMWMDH